MKHIKEIIWRMLEEGYPSRKYTKLRLDSNYDPCNHKVVVFPLHHMIEDH
jgi:hypothetical protein